jgi:hypothetical protein
MSFPPVLLFWKSSEESIKKQVPNLYERCAGSLLETILVGDFIYKLLGGNDDDGLSQIKLEDRPVDVGKVPDGTGRKGRVHIREVA